MAPTPGPIGPSWLADRVADGEVVVIDGATGSELEARGVPMVQKGWSVLAQLEHPEVLEALHRDYVAAGAAVIITNTFGAGRHLLEPGGLGDRVADAHRRATEIAVSVRDSSDAEVAVAGSISTYMADPSDRHWLNRLDATYREQAELLAEGGVDLIICEMMQDPELSRPAVDAALATGLPVWVGLSAARAEDGSLGTIDDPNLPFAASADALIVDGVGVVAVMHTAVPDVRPALEIVTGRWSGPLGVYPESGYFVEPHWQFVDIIEPDTLTTAAEDWVRSGVQILGGCCGLGVEHVRALSSRFAQSG